MISASAYPQATSADAVSEVRVIQTLQSRDLAYTSKQVVYCDDIILWIVEVSLNQVSSVWSNFLQGIDNYLTWADQMVLDLKILGCCVLRYLQCSHMLCLHFMWLLILEAVSWTHDLHFTHVKACNIVPLSKCLQVVAILYDHLACLALSYAGVTIFQNCSCCWDYNITSIGRQIYRMAQSHKFSMDAINQ